MVHFGERSGSEPRPTTSAGLLKGLAVFGSTARHFFSRILEWSKIEVGRNGFDSRSNQRLARVIHRLENALLNLAIALENLVLRLLRERLQLLHIGLHRIDEVAK